MKSKKLRIPKDEEIELNLEDLILEENIVEMLNVIGEQEEGEEPEPKDKKFSYYPTPTLYTTDHGEDAGDWGKSRRRMYKPLKDTKSGIIPFLRRTFEKKSKTGGLLRGGGDKIQSIKAQGDLGALVTRANDFQFIIRFGARLKIATTLRVDVHEDGAIVSLETLHINTPFSLNSGGSFEGQELNSIKPIEIKNIDTSHMMQWIKKSSSSEKEKAPEFGDEEAEENPERAEEGLTPLSDLLQLNEVKRKAIEKEIGGEIVSAVNNKIFKSWFGSPGTISATSNNKRFEGKLLEFFEARGAKFVATKRKNIEDEKTKEGYFSFYLHGYIRTNGYIWIDARIGEKGNKGFWTFRVHDNPNKPFAATYYPIGPVGKMFWTKRAKGLSSSIPGNLAKRGKFPEEVKGKKPTSQGSGAQTQGE